MEGKKPLGITHMVLFTVLICPCDLQYGLDGPSMLAYFMSFYSYLTQLQSSQITLRGIHVTLIRHVHMIKLWLCDLDNI